MSSEEEWRPVVGWEGLYEVSSHGRVRSLDRESLAHRQGPRWVRGKVLSPSVSGREYRRVTLHRDGKPTYKSVHRLVCESFNGSPPEKGLYARHKDDNPSNNTPANLIWGTPKENSQDAIRNRLNHFLNKDHCPKGHPYSGENLYLRPDKQGRDCRECRRASGKRAASKRGRTKTPHGKITGYSSYQCRCEPCKDAYRAWRKKYDERRRLGRTTSTD